jgi:Helix-turn-helix domain
LIAQIVAEYADGTPTTLLAKRYGIGKGTVLRLIRESGVTLRGRGPRTD